MSRVAIPVRHMMTISMCSIILSGCMVSIPQPGQTPAQVQACSTDATLHNVSVYGAGVLAGGAAAESTVAASITDPTAQKDLAIAGAVTAAVAGAATLGAELLGASYTSQGCSPVLPNGSRR